MECCCKTSSSRYPLVDLIIDDINAYQEAQTAGTEKSSVLTCRLLPTRLQLTKATGADTVFRFLQVSAILQYLALREASISQVTQLRKRHHRDCFWRNKVVFHAVLSYLDNGRIILCF